MIKRNLFLLLFLFSILGYAQIPTGYYNSASGLTGNALKVKLHDIISVGYSSQSYNSLLTTFQNTDAKANGKVWDMYSDQPGGTPAYEFTFTDNCGSYNSEGDCWNREHSFPASWFNDAAPMYTDLFHLVPTDGYVNNRRSNYGFGKVGTATWTASNGSKVGPCIYPGFTGTVFEPIDAYKGDFARSYFYMATRYKDEMPNWTSDMISNGDYTTWAKNLLLEWNNLDPVSTKEINRNNAVYNVQHNRNPFIDHPEWIDEIWGSGHTVSGIITYFNTTATPLNNLTVKIMNGTTVVKTATTAANGSFSLTGIPNGTYTLVFTTTKSWGGLNSTDALKIQRHVAGLETLTQSIKLAAADVNNSASVTSTDVLKVQRRIAGLDNAFTKPDWIFEKTVGGGNTIVVNNAAVSVSFYGICTGDVNGSFTPVFLTTPINNN